MFRHKLVHTIALVTLAAGAAFLPAQAASASTQCAMFYTVQRGDTLTRIARSYGRTLADLKAWNRLADANRIYAGQSLCVGVQTIIDDAPSGSIYTVQRGDTLTRIARRFGVDVNVLAKVNNLRDMNRIYAGQSLVIPDVTI